MAIKILSCEVCTYVQYVCHVSQAAVKECSNQLIILVTGDVLFRNQHMYFYIVIVYKRGVQKDFSLTFLDAYCMCQSEVL